MISEADREGLGPARFATDSHSSWGCALTVVDGGTCPISQSFHGSLLSFQPSPSPLAFSLPEHPSQTYSLSSAVMKEVAGKGL